LISNLNIYNKMMNLPKYYSNVCKEKDAEYSDYENFEVKFGT